TNFAKEKKERVKAVQDEILSIENDLKIKKESEISLKKELNSLDDKKLQTLKKSLEDVNKEISSIQSLDSIQRTIDKYVEEIKTCDKNIEGYRVKLLNVQTNCPTCEQSLKGTKLSPEAAKKSIKDSIATEERVKKELNEKATKE